MSRFNHIVLLLLIVFSYYSDCHAQHNRDVISVDTLDSFECLPSKSEYMIDSLKTKTDRYKALRLLYDALVRPSRRVELTKTDVIDERDAYKHLKGKTIGNITIDINDIYQDTSNFIKRIANKTHYPTRERTVRKDLLMHSGDKVDPNIIVANKHLLTSRKYIYDAYFIFTPSKEDSTVVDLTVRTHDNWTLSADGSTSLSGNSRFEIYDANFIGLGNNLSITTNFDWKDCEYGGNEVEYTVPNIAGSFFKGVFVAGKDFDNSDYGFSISKEYIEPTDFEMGAEAYARRSPYHLQYDDTISGVMSVNLMDVWIGSSKYIEKINSSIYANVRYSYSYFKDRPFVDINTNHAFHDKRFIMFGVGLYRENFLSSNLIYGFGVKEYLSAGFKTEIIGGYEWGEFGNDIILGLNMKKGGFSEFGYFMGDAKSSVNVNALNGKMTSGIVDLNMNYISNLWGGETFRLRQFINVNYTYGWDRGDGDGEVVSFTDDSGPRAFSEDIYGTNRMVLNSETVYFTPFTPLGFRFAIYGFFDVGTLGYNKNPFNNNFYSTIGAGVRVKNDRLIFSTIQLRLGFAIGKNGFLDSEYIRVQSQSRVDNIRYIPSKPDAVAFR